jgi:hypothetical protein
LAEAPSNPTETSSTSTVKEIEMRNWEEKLTNARMNFCGILMPERGRYTALQRKPEKTGQT